MGDSSSGSGLPFPPDPVSQKLGGAMGGASGGTGTAATGSGTGAGTGTGIDQNGVLAAALGGQIDKTDDLSKQSINPLANPGQQKTVNTGGEGQSQW